MHNNGSNPYSGSPPSNHTLPHFAPHYNATYPPKHSGSLIPTFTTSPNGSLLHPNPTAPTPPNPLGKPPPTVFGNSFSYSRHSSCIPIHPSVKSPWETPSHIGAFSSDKDGSKPSSYEAAFPPPSPPPTTNNQQQRLTPHSPTKIADAKISHSAQMAIDQNNLQSATAHLFSAHPQAELTPSAITNITKLYPQ